MIGSVNQLSVPVPAQRQAGTGIGVQFLSLDKAQLFDRPPSVHVRLCDGPVQRRTSVVACITNEEIARIARAPVSVSHADAVQTLLTAQTALLFCQTCPVLAAENDVLRNARLVVCKAAVAAAEFCVRAEEVKEEELQTLLAVEEEEIVRDGSQDDSIFDRMAASVAASVAASQTAIMMGSVLPIVNPSILCMGSEFNEKPIVLRASVPIMPLDALELAAEYNLGNGEKMSRYHTVDILPSRNAEGSARELVKIRDDVGGYMNINGLDLNSPATSLSGERVLNFGEFLLSKCCLLDVLLR